MLAPFRTAQQSLLLLRLFVLPALALIDFLSLYAYSRAFPLYVRYIDWWYVFLL
jgi:hypothetical protein